MSSSSDNRPLKLGIALVLILSIGFYLYTNLERYEYENQNYNDEYQRNNYFLLQTFLESLGFDVSVSKNNADILTLNDNVRNLALFESYMAYTRSSNPKIKEWVQSGGTLITTLTHSPEAGEQDFFAEFDAQNYESSSSDYDDIGCYSDKRAFFDCDNQDVITVGVEHKVLASNRYGNAVVEISYGLGHIIIMAHAFSFDNYQVADKDNAFFFSSLLNPAPESEILIIYDAYRASLMATLWRNAKLSIILFLTLVVSILWSLVQRFGPFKRLEFETKQDLKLHLQACADYSWEQNRLHQHILQLRESLLQLIQRRTGLRLPSEKQDRNHFIEKYIEQVHIELEPKTVSNGLFGSLPQDVSALMKISKQLKILRSKL